MSKLYVIMDFDSPLYGAATVLEDRYIIAKHISSRREKEFKNITEFKGKGRTPETLGGWLKEENDKRGTDFKASDFKIVQKTRRNDIPLSKAKEFVNSSAESVKGKEWCGEIRYVISGKDNYRKDLNPLYKANRPPKPIMYLELREWFIDTYKDEVIIADGCEADDILSIFGWWGYNKALKSGDYKDNNICLVYIDKDMKQIPGYFWNFRSKKEKPDWQTESKAAKSFWTQMITGDTSDNITGLEGVTKEVRDKYHLRGKSGTIGAVGASTVLSDCETKEDIEKKVLYLYNNYYCDIYKEKFQEAYQMLKLQDKKGEIPEYNFKEEL